MFYYFLVITMVFSTTQLSVCRDVTCPDVKSFRYGDIVTSSKRPYRVGSVLKFKCDRGYKGRGSINIRCLESGRWSDSVPYCLAYSCKRDLRKVEQGRRCRKSCKSDADCRGKFKRCLCDDWCGKSCYNPDSKCLPPEKPMNGYVLGSDFTYGYSITYGCNKGFGLVGSESRHCRSDRKWSGDEPKCVAFTICGLPGDVDQSLVEGKVVQGKSANVGAWPWQVLLLDNSTEENAQNIYERKHGFAGGSIINSKWIMTASHVFHEKYKNYPHRNWKYLFLIVLGMTAFPDPDTVLQQHIQIYDAFQIITHPKYDSINFDYDIALVRIGNRLIRSGDVFEIDYQHPAGFISFSRFVRPVCLPCIRNLSTPIDIWRNFDNQSCDVIALLKNSDIKPGDEALVTGFGSKRFRGSQPKVLQEGLLRILDDDKCIASAVEIEAIQQSGIRYTDRMLCAHSANESLRTDACQGDSGGPLVKKYGDFQWKQVGIVSWGYECGNKYPGYYVSLPSVMPWIWSILDKKKRGLRCYSHVGSVIVPGELNITDRTISKCNEDHVCMTIRISASFGGNNRSESIISDCLPISVRTVNCSAVALSYYTSYRSASDTRYTISDCAMEICDDDLCNDPANIPRFEGGPDPRIKRNKTECYSIMRSTSVGLNAVYVHQRENITCEVGYQCLLVRLVSSISLGGLSLGVESYVGHCQHPVLCSTRICLAMSGSLLHIGETKLKECQLSCCKGDYCNDLEKFDFNNAMTWANATTTTPHTVTTRRTQPPARIPSILKEQDRAARVGSQSVCNPNPCKNGGSCMEEFGISYCSCLKAFTGTLCERRDFQNACNPNPCKNGGYCKIYNDVRFSCFCRPGFAGRRCQRSN